MAAFALFAALPAGPALALQGAPDSAQITKLMNEGKTFTEAYNLLRSLAAAVEMEKAAVTAGAGSATANVAAHMVKTPTGWAAIRPALTASPYAVAALVGTIMANWSGKQAARAIYGDGTGSQPGDGTLMRFQYTENSRHVWVTPNWQGQTISATSGGCYNGTNTLWWAVLQIGQDPGMIGCAGDVITWNPRSGENWVTLDMSNAPIVQTTTENGVTLNKYAIPSTKIRFIRAGRVQASNNGWAQFKLNDAQLPAIGPQLKQDALADTTWEDLGKIASEPANGGQYQKAPATVVAPGDTVIAPDPVTGEPTKRVWGAPEVEGDGIEADPSTPTPTPVPTATPSAAVKVVTVTEEVTETTETTDELGKKTTTSTTTRTEELPESSFVEHFIVKVKTKAPFDWSSDIDFDLDCEDDLYWISWQGVEIGGIEHKLVGDDFVTNSIGTPEPMQETWDLNWTKVFWQALAACYMVGLGVLAILML